MGIFSNLFKKPSNPREITELSHGKPKSFVKNFFVKAVSLVSGADDKREMLSAPEYNLKEIQIVSDADSYVKMALMKYSYMLFKAGYKLNSENEEASKYIATRFYIMSFSTGKPIDVLFQEVGDDLIRYSNAFLVKSRVKVIMPGINAHGVFNSNPIGGYFRVDPSTMSIERDKYGTIKKYVQVVDGEEKTFQPSEVIHYYLDKEAANAFGTPRIVAALEDVKMLRRIEGNMIALIHRHSMPLYHIKMGDMKVGFQASDREVEEMKYLVNDMPLDGTMVTNEKVNIENIGANGTALNIQPYLEYFEKRVFSALGVSETQMGRGSTGSNADSMESQAHDTVKYIQKKFSEFTEAFIINELLLEGGFNPITNENDRVYFNFNEISLDTKIKVENHMINQFQSNVITFEEMRREIDRREEVDEERLYQRMISDESQLKLADANTENSIKIAEVQGQIQKQIADAQSTGSSSVTGSGTKKVNPKGNGTSKSANPNKQVKNTDQPRNQHGQTSVKIKESFSPRKHKQFNDIYDIYNDLKEDIKNDIDNIDILCSVAYTSINEKIKSHLLKYNISGINDALSELKKNNHNIISTPLEPFINESNDTIKRIFIDIKKRIKNDEDVDLVFDALKYRIKFLLEYLPKKVYWYSYLKAGESCGVYEAFIDFGKSEDKEKYKKYKKINIKSLNIDNIPPFHSFCSCKIHF